MLGTSRVRSGNLWLFKVRGSRTIIHFHTLTRLHSILLLPIHSCSYFPIVSNSLSSIFTFLLYISLFLAPSQKHIILHTNLSVRQDSVNMSLRGQSMQKMEVMLLVRNSGIGNPNRNLRRRSWKKRRRSRGNNVRTIVPKCWRLEWLKRETNSALEPLLVLLPTSAPQPPAEICPFFVRHNHPLRVKMIK